MGRGVLLFYDMRLFANHAGDDDAIINLRSKQARSIREGPHTMNDI